MRESLFGVVWLMVAAALAHAGCGTAHDDVYEPLTNPDLTGGGDGTGGGVPAGCVPSEAGKAVGDECGVFVSSHLGADTNDGTTGAPVQTLATAITQAGERGTGRVYACAEEFEEKIEVPGGVTLFGGLDCANGWGWIGESTKTTLTAAEGEIPLVMRGGAGTVRVEDFHVMARGIGSSSPEAKGKSSIAAVAEALTVELRQSVLEAGDAAPGANGEAFTMGAKGGSAGNAGGVACSAAAVIGGLDAVNDCGTPDASDDSVGGIGGTATQNNGGDGSNGLPNGSSNGGSGENTTVCIVGTTGSNGGEGMSGSGATGLGTISAAGYSGVLGSDGARGKAAQGGGGGGGAKGGIGAGKCASATSAGGASGGSGGSGGCGGAGGKAGGAGGSSIALISLGATLMFDGTTLKTGKGGDGGVGGQGQSGGSGGDGGLGGTLPAGVSALNAGCRGGKGGTGGKGGHGGGGLGGHALGIAFQGTNPSTENAMFEIGKAGQGGDGGDAQNGVAAKMQEFTLATSSASARHGVQADAQELTP